MKKILFTILFLFLAATVAFAQQTGEGQSSSPDQGSGTQTYGGSSDQPGASLKYGPGGKSRMPDQGSGTQTYGGSGR
jgi:hypothetical protein